MPGGKNTQIVKTDNTLRNQASVVVAEKNNIDKINTSVSVALDAVNKKYLTEITKAKIIPYNGMKRDCDFYNISKVVYNRNENVGEKFVSLYTALYEAGLSVALIIKGVRTKGVEVYICCPKVSNSELIMRAVKSQFPGSDCNQAMKNTGNIMPNTTNTTHFSALSVIPGKRTIEKQEQREFSTQGIEKFIDGMLGSEYTFMIVSEPVTQDTITTRREGLQSFYSLISGYKSEQISLSKNTSRAVTNAYAEGFSKSVSLSTAKSFGVSNTDSHGSFKSDGYNSGGGVSLFGISSNRGRNRNYGDTNSVAFGTTTGDTNTDTSTDSDNITDTKTKGETTGKSESITLTTENKFITDALDILDEQLLRIKQNAGFGMWDCAAYIFSESADTIRSCIHRRFKSVCRCEIVAIHSADDVLIS